MKLDISAFSIPYLNVYKTEILIIDVNNNETLECFTIETILDELEMYRIFEEIGLFDVLQYPYPTNYPFKKKLL